MLIQTSSWCYKTRGKSALGLMLNQKTLSSWTVQLSERDDPVVHLLLLKWSYKDNFIVKLFYGHLKAFELAVQIFQPIRVLQNKRSINLHWKYLYRIEAIISRTDITTKFCSIIAMLCWNKAIQLAKSSLMTFDSLS